MSSNLFILDGQNDSILDHINKKYVTFNEHEQDLPTYKNLFRFTALGDKRYAEHLGKRNGIIAPGEDGELLEFRIFESIKYRDSEGLKVEVYSLATYLDLKTAKVFDPQKTSAETAELHAKIALSGTEWQLGEVAFKGVRTLEFDSPFNSYDYLKRIARDFELELRFYVTTDGKKVTGRYVDLVERVGEFRGRTVEFGRDLQRIERKENTDDIVTALWVYGPQREDGTRLKVFVEDDEARQRWGRRGQHIIDYYEPQTENQDITEERLETLGNMELKKRINAVVTYEADIVDLENVPGMENKKIRFGDTIRIKDTKFSPPLYVEARVFNQKRDVFNKSRKSVQLGDYVEYTEDEVKAIFRQYQESIRRRLERLILVSIVSSAGNVFKNGVGSTELTAKTFLSGNEVDEDGTKYEYRWHKFDKNGDYVPGFYEEGKTISVSANTIDEKASFRVEIILDDEVLTVHEITLTNVFDGEDGEPGPPGPKGDKGDKGDPGPQGPPGTSITSIVEYYLATDQNSGVTTSTPGWTTTMQQMTPQKRYLWNYERINFSDGTHQNTNPVIIGVYGDEGEEGRSIVGITEYYLATNASSGVTRSTSGWTTTMQVTTPEKRYLWNYEEITWNKAPTKTYTEPVIIGVHGEQGPKGEDGKTFYTWIKYADTPTSGMSDSPEGKEYIGIAYNKETPTPSTNYADYVWSKFKGEQGVPGPPGEDGQPTYTWVKYADDDKGNGMSDSPDGKLYIGLAFNKTTPEESNNPADYTWSLMPQNIEIGGRNLITQSSVSGYIVTVNGYVYTLTKTPSIAGNPHVRIPHTLFENDTEYVITFKARKVSGNVYRLAGHSTLARHETTRLFIDGIEQTHKLTNGWSNVGTANFPNDNEVHHYEIRFKTVSDVASVSTPYWYIQPNRPQYDSDSFVLEIWDWKLEKGNKATDWTPAPEDVQEQIDEAKQEAEEAKQEAQNAMSTADGKNTVFRQSSTPPTTNRKIGDLWFKTDEGNKMFVWTGSWTETKLDHQALSVGKLSALSADLGNITAGRIQGVDIHGGTITQTGEDNRKIILDDSGLRKVDSAGDVRIRITNRDSFSEVGFSEALIEFNPNAANWRFLVGADLPGLGDGFIGFPNSASNRTFWIRNEGSGSFVGIESRRIILNGIIEGSHTLILPSTSYSFLRPDNPSNELRVANSSGQWSTVRAYTANPSSEKWKTDIKDVDFSAIEVLKQSKIYSFIRDGRTEREIGFVLERETPEILKDGEGVNSYSHSSLNSLAIKELIERLEQFEGQVAVLTEENEQLKSEIEKLKGNLNAE